MATAAKSSSSRIDLTPIRDIEGYIGAALVDSESGMTLATDGGGERIDIDTAAAGNADVVRKKREVMKKLRLNEKIEDILISLHQQYHLIRPLDSNDAIFVYLALDRSKANLGMARMDLSRFEKGLDLS